MKRVLGPVLLTLGLGVSGAAAQAPAAPSVEAGAFTAAQAMRGMELFNTVCASCHGADLTALSPNGMFLEGVPLTGDGFALTWVGNNVAERYSFIKLFMPGNMPGILTEEQTLDALAYILSFNGFPAGMTELTLGDHLAAMIIPPPPARP